MNSNSIVKPSVRRILPENTWDWNKTWLMSSPPNCGDITRHFLGVCRCKRMSIEGFQDSITDKLIRLSHVVIFILFVLFLQKKK
jgi:hypothetical protein